MSIEDLLRFLETYEIWIYLLLGIIFLLYLRKVLDSWHEWRASLFGIEREIAQRGFSFNLTILILVLFLGMAQFILISFVAPDMPRVDILPTPTIDLLATPVTTLAVTLAPATTPTSVSLPTLVVTGANGCVAGTLEWTYPKNGGQLKGSEMLKGTIQVPNLGFYKYEYSSAGSDNWVTIAAGNQKVTDHDLGTWDTSQLVPGDYRLRLVVADNKNQALPACIITVRILSP
ncbi:MAG TPA: hypothetical protein VMS73_01300 [Anaerolineaceae bacterium]|nr:hypothetical protein [Anaerolineaceae bacterium]